MAKVKAWKASAQWTPAVIGADETTPIFNVPKGTRVRSMSVRVDKAAASSTDSSFVLGDGTATNGFFTTFDTETNAAGTIVDAAGTFTNQSGGRLYLVADTIDIVYSHGTTPGATKPVYTFRGTFEQEWP